MNVCSLDHQKQINDFFEENGYYVYKNICDPKDYIRPVPTQGGLITYWGDKLNQFNYEKFGMSSRGITCMLWTSSIS